MNICRRPSSISCVNYIALSLIFALALAAALPRPLRAQDITYSQDPDAAKRMTLLLRDYEPHSTMHAAVHPVPRAKFPVIDVHNHVNDPGGVHGEEIPPPKLSAAWTPRT